MLKRIIVVFICFLAISPAAQALTLEQKVLIVFRSIAKVSREPAKKIDGKFCSTSKRCDAYFGGNKVSIFGKGTVVIKKDPKIALKDYIVLCAAAFSGLSGHPLKTSVTVIGGAFGVAGKSGKFKETIGKTDVYIEHTKGKKSECRFF